MKSAIEGQIAYCIKHPSCIQGWAVCFVGTKRSSYVSFKDGKPTFSESEAKICTKREAGVLITKFAGTALWKYARICPVRGDVKKDFMLPTINGY
jgi:hypothetical protein